MAPHTWDAGALQFFEAFNLAKKLSKLQIQRFNLDRNRFVIIFDVMGKVDLTVGTHANLLFKAILAT